MARETQKFLRIVNSRGDDAGKDTRDYAVILKMELLFPGFQFRYSLMRGSKLKQSLKISTFEKIILVEGLRDSIT